MIRSIKAMVSCYGCTVAVIGGHWPARNRYRAATRATIASTAIGTLMIRHVFAGRIPAAGHSSVATIDRHVSIITRSGSIGQESAASAAPSAIVLASPVSCDP
jgi:hypothetical protein